MRTKLQRERNALIATMDYLRTHPNATARELWFNLYRADILVPIGTYRRWLRRWVDENQHTNIVRFQPARNRYQYALLGTEQPTFTALMERADRYLRGREKS